MRSRSAWVKAGFWVPSLSAVSAAGVDAAGATVPPASASHFFTKLVLAAPASFFSAAWASSTTNVASSGGQTRAAISAGFGGGAREEIGRAAPIVHALCAPGGVASAANLAELADKTLPVIMQAVADSTLPDTEKQNILLSIALAQVALAAAR